MNPNSTGFSNGLSQPSQNSQSYSQSVQNSTAMPQYTINVSTSSPSYQYEQSGQTSQSSSNNFLYAQQPLSDNKDKSKLPNSKSTGGLGLLSAMARQVNDPIVETKTLDLPGATNNNQKYGMFYGKYSGGTQRDSKMVSSAIFSNNQPNPDLNRFPAFNFGANKTTQQPVQPLVPKANQTAKQKRERELMQIKKQLDELNKKMVINTQKNKNSAPSSYLQPEQRPNKPIISHSVIFEPSNNPNYNYPSFNNNFSDSKPTSNQGLSLDQLYSQKKNNVSVSSSKNIEEVPPKKSTYDPLAQFNNSSYASNQKSSTNTYETSNISKPLYEFERKKQQPIVNKNYPSYDYSKPAQSPPSTSYSYDPSPKKDTNYTYTPYSQTGQSGDKKSAYQGQSTNYSYNISPNSNTNPSSGSGSGSSYSYSPGSSSSTNTSTSSSKQNDKGYAYTFKANQPYQTKQYKPASSQSSSLPSYNPSKQDYSYSPTATPSQPGNQVPSSTSQVAQQVGGFKKKKGPDPSQVKANIIDMKQPVYDATTSYQPHVSHTTLRKTDSLAYQDPNFKVPELKNFKVSDFAMGKKMGKGQFGQVMLVRHKQTGWVCGLKVMNKKDIKDQDYAGQIARQLSIQFYLSHRNIAQLFGYFSDQKNFYLLIQFCTGGQLLQKLKVQRRMSERDVSLIIRQVCQGVDYIHRQLIIHRDIKPQNILFNYGVVKISDFGWAVYRGFGMRKTASGSPLYYPPQIVKGESYDDKIDIWCIGMMAYECIIGKIPFRVYTQMDLGRIVSDQITFPEWVDVTDQAKDFILKTLKKKGDERMEIKQMLRHPFITKHQENQLSPAILDEFKRVLGG